MNVVPKLLLWCTHIASTFTMRMSSCTEQVFTSCVYFLHRPLSWCTHVISTVCSLCPSFHARSKRGLSDVVRDVEHLHEQSPDTTLQSMLPRTFQPVLSASQISIPSLAPWWSVVAMDESLRRASRWRGCAANIYFLASLEAKIYTLHCVVPSAQF